MNEGQKVVAQQEAPRTSRTEQTAANNESQNRKDQRLQLFKAIVEKKYREQPKNLNLQLLHIAVNEGKGAIVTLPSGLKLRLDSFDSGSGVATFISDRGDRQVQVRIGHLVRNTRAQTTKEKTEQGERKKAVEFSKDEEDFLDETFVKDEKNNPKPDFSALVDLKHAKLAESLGLSSPASLQTIASEISGASASVETIIQELPANTQVMTPSIIEQAVQTIIEKADAATKQIETLRQLIQKAGDKSPLTPFLKSQLNSAMRLQHIADNFKHLNVLRVIDYYKNAVNGEPTHVNNLNVEVEKVIDQPDRLDIGQLLRLFGLPNGSLPGAERLKNMVSVGLKNSTNTYMRAVAAAKMVMEFTIASAATS